MIEYIQYKLFIIMLLQPAIWWSVGQYRINLDRDSMDSMVKLVPLQL